jgi:hypothetical protein
VRKKHFVSLGAVLRDLRPNLRPNTRGYIDPVMARCQLERYTQWEYTTRVLADWCASQSATFKRDRWLQYIAGECGPNGGAVKPKQP